MKLAAHLAARMFIRGRMRKETRRRPPSWVPMSLRWRTIRRRAPTPAMRLSLQADSKTWLPQFHLHFSRTEPAAAAPRQISATPTRTTAISWRHFSQRLTSVLPIVRTHSVSEMHNALHRTHRDVVARYRTTRETTTPAPIKLAQGASGSAGQPTFRTASAPLAQHAAIRIWGRRSLAADTVEGDVPRRRLSPIALDLSTTGRNAPREPRARSAKPEARQLVAMSHHAPELVWRAYTNDAVTAPAGTFAGPAAPPRPLPATPAPPATWQTQGNTSARPLPLDAAMVDRLAEDVIRRVERRVRIERERRGV